MDHKTDTDSAADALIRKLRDILDESRSYIGAPTFSPSMDSEAAVAVDLADQYLAGRASLAASAGSEPVASAAQAALETLERTHQSLARQLDLIAERAPGNFLDKRPVVSTLTMHQKRTEAAAVALRSALDTHPSPPEGAGWKPIAEAPQNGRALLLGYFNSAGKWRTTRGQWMSQDYIYEYAEDPDCMSPGWHETTVEDDDGKCWPIDPTHFMPLPAPPASEAKEA